MAGLCLAQLGDDQPVLLYGIAIAGALLSKPAQNGGEGLAVFHAPFDPRSRRIEGAEGLHRCALCGCPIAEGDEASKIALPHMHIVTGDAGTRPFAAFVLTLRQRELLACLEIEIAVEACDF